MTLPKQSEIELPLLRALVRAGGEARPRDVYPRITEAFPQITEADLADRLKHGESRWHNRIQWTRQALVSTGAIDATVRGVWRITEAGRELVERAETRGTERIEVSATPNLEAVWGDYEAAFREQTLERLQDLTAEQFERFGREFLRAYGFTSVEVTRVGPDGGLDGHGRLRVGVATMGVAFQCKKWQGQVGRPKIDEFRGAIQGAFEQGIFFTTSSFSKPARDASIKKGAVPVVLIDGEQIVQVMIEKGLGVSRRPLFMYDEIDIPGVDESVDD